jgi:hypothetical protein
VAAQETTLAAVLARMLRVADMWERFAEQYARALEDLRDGSARRLRGSSGSAWRRADALVEWHGLLRENLVDTQPGLLDKITAAASAS